MLPPIQPKPRFGQRPAITFTTTPPPSGLRAALAAALSSTTTPVPIKPTAPPDNTAHGLLQQAKPRPRLQPGLRRRPPKPERPLGCLPTSFSRPFHPTIASATPNPPFRL